MELQAMVAWHGHRLEALIRLSEKNRSDEARFAKLKTLIAMREKAVGYLWATAKYLVHKENHPLTLRQKPTFFAAPSWRHGDVAKITGESTDVPFMEFSS
ncbi:MAG: hypothetical protein GC165_12325 [Armatimonadetes bacterium]|nr:hypothetical protein [Armatimonadota bacterium]